MFNATGNPYPYTGTVGIPNVNVGSAGYMQTEGSWFTSKGTGAGCILAVRRLTRTVLADID